MPTPQRPLSGIIVLNHMSRNDSLGIQNRKGDGPRLGTEIRRLNGKDGATVEAAAKRGPFQSPQSLGTILEPAIRAPGISSYEEQRTVALIIGERVFQRRQ